MKTDCCSDTCYVLFKHRLTANSFPLKGNMGWSEKGRAWVGLQLDPKSLVTELRVAVLGCSRGPACGHIHDLWTFRAGADGTGQGGGSGTSGPVRRVTPAHVLIDKGGR